MPQRSRMNTSAIGAACGWMNSSDQDEAQHANNPHNEHDVEHARVAVVLFIHQRTAGRTSTASRADRDRINVQ